MTYCNQALKIVRKYRLSIILACIFFVIIIHENTIVHPYMLADNRHYFFYIWNKFYGRFWWARYIVVPFYLISIVILHLSISMRSAGFQLIFISCTIANIMFQQLIEIRYFILPFLIIRISSSSAKFKMIFLELIVYTIINIVVFYLFYSKEIVWSDYSYVQKLIW